MKQLMTYNQKSIGRRSIASGILFAFLVTGITSPVQQVYAQELFYLPAVGTRVSLSPEFAPAVLKGIKVHADNPFRFDFILD